MTVPFADRLCRRMAETRSRACLGLDPDLSRLPAALLAEYGMDAPPAPGDDEWRARAAACIWTFCEQAMDAAADSCAAVKPQAAWFELLGPEGVMALRQVNLKAMGMGLPVILDGKRNDIGRTAAQYARAYLGPAEGPHAAAVPADALTVTPYLGSDGIQPLLDRCSDHGCGIFVLAATSNPSGAEIQDLELARGGCVADRVASMINGLGEGLAGESGYGPAGAVVGATRPDVLQRLRSAMPEAVFLLPGFGAQGAGPGDVAPAFDRRGLGAVVNASRSLLFGPTGDPDGEDFPRRIMDRTEAMRRDIEAALDQSGHSSGGAM